MEFVVDSIRGKKYKYYSIRCPNIDAQHFRQVFRGSPKDNTSARPCIAEDGPTGSFIECSGLDGADEKSVRNEGWSHNG